MPEESPVELPPYNPFDPIPIDAHQEVLTQLRRACPVAEVQPGLFYVSRHQEILEVCRQPALYRQGRFHRSDEADHGPDQMHLGETDPPEHTVVRKALSSALSVSKVRTYEPAVARICEEIADRFAERPTGEVIADLGVPLPGRVIGFVAGFPTDTWDALRAYSDDYMVMGTEGSDPGDLAAATARVSAFDDRIRREIRARRAAAQRPPDLMTALVEATDDRGTPLSDEKVLTHLTKDVIVGGTETTTHLIGNMFFQLLSTEGLYQRVRDDRSLVPAVAEESLRHLPVVQILFRVPAEDTELAGVAIPAGSNVGLGYASANRDERLFTHPDTFDLDRGRAGHQHLGFGWGIHLCVGAPLARLEARLMLNAVLDRVPVMRLADDFEYRRVPFGLFQAPQRVDVVLG